MSKVYCQYTGGYTNLDQNKSIYLIRDQACAEIDKDAQPAPERGCCSVCTIQAISALIVVNLSQIKSKSASAIDEN